MPSHDPTSRAAARLGTSRILTRAFAVWTVVGLLSILAYLVPTAHRGRPLDALSVSAHVLTDVWLWALYTPVILGAVARWPVAGPERRLVHAAIHALLFVLLTAVAAATAVGVGAALGEGGSFANAFFALLTLNLISYAAVVAIGHSRLLVGRLVAAEARTAQLSAQLATAQLSSLRAQLHPHFFFNTLNAVAEMIHRDPEAADRMVTRLGAFLRRSLDSSDVQEVPLGDELEALSAYLDVVQLRFGERIEVSLQAEPEALCLAVPPLILQPLVENALRHGLEPKEGGGYIEVTAELQGRALRLEVRDDGLGLPLEGPVRERVGLRNTRERLAQLYGDAADLSLRPRPGGGVIATVLIPRRGLDAARAAAPHPSTHAENR